MGFEANTGLGVFNHYGARETGRGAGVFETDGLVNELVIDVNADLVSTGNFVVTPIIPKGAIILNAYATVTEVFALGGTTPTILIGTDGTEVTNGVVVTQAEAQAIGSYTLATAGTWTGGTGLAADTTVGIALGGTTPTITTAGRMRVVIEFTKAAAVA